MNRLRLSVVILLLIGCGENDNGGPAPEVYVSDRLTDLELDLTVSPGGVQIGKAIAIDLQVHNPTSQRIEVQYANSCVINFEVRDGDGVYIAPTRVCLEAPVVYNIGPGETRFYGWEWRGESVHAPSPVPPGAYYITAGFVDRAYDSQLEYAPDPVRVDIVSALAG